MSERWQRASTDGPNLHTCPLLRSWDNIRGGHAIVSVASGSIPQDEVDPWSVDLRDSFSSHLNEFLIEFHQAGPNIYGPGMLL